MNLGSVGVALRERVLLESLDLTLPFVRRLGRQLYLVLGLILLVPAWALVAALHYALGWAWGWVWLLALVLASVLEGAFTIAAGQLMFTPSVRAWDVLRQYGRTLGPLLVALGASWALIALSSFTFVFPLILWIRHQFIHEVVSLEGVRTRAFDRSRRVASEGAAPGAALGLWLTFARVFMVIGAELVASTLVDRVFELGNPLGTLWSEGGSPYALAGLFLSVPFIATGRFLVYVDQRTRTDAWDVQVRFLKLGGSTEAEA